MSNPRRLFLSQLGTITGAIALSKPLKAATSITKHINTSFAAKNVITVYHSNNLHGQIDAVHKNFGGLRQIKKLLENQETNGVLFDAGNFINGTNSLAQQKQVIYLMNAIGYHAAAVGAGELSLGQDHLASLTQLMNFTLLNCNYEFNSNLSSIVKPYIIINSDKFRIGITGVGKPHHEIKYHDAITSANQIAGLLKNDKKCDLVICLSQLGDKEYGDMPDNHKLAAQSENIDVIISGNDYKLNGSNLVLSNKLEHEVILALTACHGTTLGKTSINFNNKKQKSGVEINHFVPGGPAGSFNASFSELQRAKNHWQSA